MNKHTVNGIESFKATIYARLTECELGLGGIMVIHITAGIVHLCSQYR